MSFHDQMFTAAGVQALGREWFDCEIPEGLASCWSYDYIDAHNKRNNGEYAITAAFPCVFLKTRLNDLGLLPVANSAPAAAPVVTAVFHVGFLTLPETLEMWQRLWNENLRTDSHVARSAIFKAAEKINPTPIDATAAIVTHGEGRPAH